LIVRERQHRQDVARQNITICQSAQASWAEKSVPSRVVNILIGESRSQVPHKPILLEEIHLRARLIGEFIGAIIVTMPRRSELTTIENASRISFIALSYCVSASREGTAPPEFGLIGN
jgi:hypothetical protein